MPTTPVDIINRARDECGIEALGDLDDTAARIYWPTLRQVLAGAPWNFARKQISMTLLADTTGQTVGLSTNVTSPWAYAYEWPTDCVHARWIPRSYQSNLGTPLVWNSPAPFLVANAPFINDIASNWADIEGHDPESTRVILTNEVNAQLVYTGMMQYPDAWDPLFEQAMVAVLAARIAMPSILDKKEARLIRSDNIQIAREALAQARVRDGNEGWTVQDHTPDWIRARTGSGQTDLTGVVYSPWINIAFLEDAGGVY